MSPRWETRLDAPPRDLWPILSNTNRINRVLALPEMTVRSVSPGDFSQAVSSRLLGLGLSWREPPFEWVEPRYWRIVREFDRGILERFEGRLELSPEGAGTRASFEAEFRPRGTVGKALVGLILAPRTMRDMRSLVEGVGAAVAAGRSEPVPVRRVRAPADARLLDQRRRLLERSKADSGAARRLIAHLREGYDDEIVRMRPFEWADRWRTDRTATLVCFLHAVKAGLLDLSWEILCPNCSAAKERLSSLSALQTVSRCDSCEAEFGVDLQENVELRFSVNPAIRPAVTAVFCAGSPVHAPQAALQCPLAPGEERVLRIELPPEAHSLRCLQGKWSAALRPAASGARELAVAASGRPDGELAFAPGPLSVRLSNPTPGPVLLRLERESWRDKGARASLVTALQEFRSLFSAEVLSPDVQISIRSIALLFSDLKGSTALYERIGDAGAYAVVRDHFAYMFEIIARRRGGVVKTIGDAVMAAFPSAADALEAAFDIQERIGELNRRLVPRPPVVIKLGLHHGPAIAINAGGLLDYFGTTVNVAARVQNESAGGDIVVSAGVYEDAGAAEVLARRRHREEPLTIQLRGLSDSFRLRRLLPSPEPA